MTEPQSKNFEVQGRQLHKKHQWGIGLNHRTHERDWRKRNKTSINWKLSFWGFSASKKSSSIFHEWKRKLSHENTAPGDAGGNSGTTVILPGQKDNFYFGPFPGCNPEGTGFCSYRNHQQISTKRVWRWEMSLFAKTIMKRGIDIMETERYWMQFVKIISNIAKFKLKLNLILIWGK